MNTNHHPQTADSAHQESQKAFSTASQWLPGGNSRHSVFFKPHPLYAHHAKGCRLTDADGVERIDCINNMSALIHGHGYPPVVEAVTDQLQHLMSAGMPTMAEIALAEALCSRVDSVEKVRFCTSGSESIMFAIRAARAYTGRYKIAKAEGAYHGSYDSVEFSLTPGPDAAGPAASPHSVPATPGLPRDAADQTLVFSFNDTDQTVAMIEANADDLAAVIIDPVISRMGFVQGERAYLRAVREACTRHDIVLIFDEIFSFRIAAGGGQAWAGVRPDLSTFGKVIGGGLPIGAVGGSTEHMAVFDQLHSKRLVEHSGTHFANPLSMAAGLAALKALDEDCLGRLASLGERLRTGIDEAFGRHGVAGHAAGVGSLVCAIPAAEPLTNYRQFMQTMASDGVRFGQVMHRAMLERGAHIVPGGGFILSSVMSYDDIDALIAMFDDSLASYRAAENVA